MHQASACCIAFHYSTFKEEMEDSCIAFHHSTCVFQHHATLSPNSFCLHYRMRTSHLLEHSANRKDCRRLQLSWLCPKSTKPFRVPQPRRSRSTNGNIQCDLPCLQAGDKIVRVSASFGTDVWDAKNFGQVMYAIRTRNGDVYMEFEPRYGAPPPRLPDNQASNLSRLHNLLRLHCMKDKY
jgi:hypothetical protein